MKLCKDCRHYRQGRHGFGLCNSPNNGIEQNIVHGPRPIVTICQDQRAVWRVFDVFNNRCGRRGRWFDPKEPK